MIMIRVRLFRAGLSGGAPPQPIFHWLRVGGKLSRENYVTEKDILKFNAFLERPGGPDSFFLELQTHT